MRRISVSLILSLIITSHVWGQKPWQQLSQPKAEDVAARFKSPPPEYAVTVTWGWDGPITEEVIIRDLDMLHQRGFRAVTIEAGYDMNNAPYLTEGWFKLVRFAVDQAKVRGMRVWIIDEGKYPSGFAGGLFSKLRPDLCMMGLGVAKQINTGKGEFIACDLPEHTIGVLAVNRDNGENTILDVSKNKIEWMVPDEGNWQLFIIDYNYRTPVTRAVNDSTRAKTTKNSVGDLINPEAVEQFITWTHEQYKKYLGQELGTTVLGFRGDELEFAATPWTDGILDLFKEKKGYDVTPYLPYCVHLGRRGPRVELTDEQRRAKADYWDIWSQLYGKYFFGLQAKWCADNGVEHMTHLNNEHRLEALTFTSGDYFRDLREVQIPGVDSIWNQVWPGKNADFVRLPASVAHVYGKPRVLSESYAAYNESPVTVETAEWGVNYQMVRGVNLFEFMFFPASSKEQAKIRQQYSYMADPEFPGMMASVNRACYAMSQGRSDARIAVYFPSLSFWYGDYEPNNVIWTLAQQLMEQQHDFDFVDDEAVGEVMKLDDGSFTNLSGQSYKVVILPSVSAISKVALDRLQAFAKRGGKVIILGDEPELVVDRSFMAAKKPKGLSWAVKEKNIGLTDKVKVVLPSQDVIPDQLCGDLKVMHKRWQDADVYFLFNEVKKPLTRTINLMGKGTVQQWVTQTGRIEAVPAVVTAEGKIELLLEFKPYEAKLLVVGPAL
ncbi:MAG: hypothetical protein JW837_15765 [Sedimentisphaerales bacterium]|nr:hypothetical protein [Sedimentisphaerales bacterium]